MDRRQFLKSSAALAGGIAAQSLLAGTARAASNAQTLEVTTRTLDVNGKDATVYRLGTGAKPGLTFNAGDTFNISLKNGLTEPTIVHWHGLIPPFDQDGVADNPLPMLPGGSARTYDFPLDRPGTYWMHAHTLQHQNLLSAPLIVQSKDDAKADLQEVVLMLHDFSFTPAAELLSKLTGGSGHSDHGSMDQGAMGQGSGDMSGMDMGSMDMDAMPMGAMDLNDINYDAYLANDRTLGDPEIVSIEKGGRVRLRVINGAASTAFMISTGSLQAQLIAADGQPVQPLAGNAFPLSMGQRLDLVVDIPSDGGAFPILAAREGTVDRTGIILATSGAPVKKIAATGDKAGILDLALEQRLVSTQPLATRPPDRKFMVHLAGDMATYQWGMMGAEDLAAKPGERVEISIMNMSMMAHPMHLHGHHFQVVGIDGKRFPGALRDTILVPPMKTVTIAFDAGREGKWPFHCHHLYHMVSGMMGYVQVG